MGSSNDACAETANRLPRAEKINNFMFASLPDELATPYKPTAQISKPGTNACGVPSGLTRGPLQYLAWLVLALLVNPAFAAEDARLVDLKLPAHFDPFAPEAKAQYEFAARTACAVPKPAGFVGYRWRLPAVAAELRQMTGESPGKQIYIAFLKSKYGYQIVKLNADYGTDAQSFTELLDSPMKRGLSAHDQEFEAPIRKEMADEILGALRRCDPSHAAGGLRLLLR